MARLLERWHILDAVRECAVPLHALSSRRYADDTELARVSMLDVEKAYGAPILVIHRADLQFIMKKKAEELGAQIILGFLVEDIDFDTPRIKVKGYSEWFETDLVIAADGIKSIIRKKMFESEYLDDQIRETGDAAWRAVIPSEQIYQSNDASLIQAIEENMSLRWMGPSGHIMVYPIRSHTLLNMVLLHPDEPGTLESWTMKGDKSKMVAFYKNWNDRVRRLIDCISNDDIIEWKLCDHAPLVTWVKGKVALIGDAAHPMLPYVAQGAAQAVEDSAVLSTCLALIDTKDEIPTALKAYELVRKERAEIVQMSAAKTRLVLHLHDGEEQQKRDEVLRNVQKGGVSPDLWSDKSFQDWCWVSKIQHVYIVAMVSSRALMFKSKCFKCGILSKP